MSLRARLLLVTVGLVAAGLVVADVVTYRLVDRFLTNRVDQQLHNTDPRDILRNANRGQGPDPGSAPIDVYAEVLDASGQVVGGYWPATGPKLPHGLPGSTSARFAPAELFTASSSGSGSYRVLASPSPPPFTGTIVLAEPLSNLHATLASLAHIELVVTAIIVLGLGGLAFWLVRVGLRPLRRMGETAGAIAAGDLSKRVQPATERTEVGRLGLSLNTMLSQIEAAFAEREQATERLRRFVGDASHELRTPLASIRGYSELFRLGAASRPDDLARAMRRIEDEAARMGLLVDDLLLLARLDQGRPLETEAVDLSAIAADGVADAQAIEPDRPLTFDDGELLTVIGDEARLRQVVANLLANVRQHTPVTTPAEVRLRRDDGDAVLEVADHGPGLPEGDEQKVLERFYRADPSRTRESGGTGLGLSIVTAIVEAHGGRIEISATPGGGATFGVRLPLRSEVGLESEPTTT